LLVSGLTQLPPQTTSPEVQMVTHTPPKQAWPAVHVAPAAAPVQPPEAPQ
jgi:hypothetical protein